VITVLHRITREDVLPKMVETISGWGAEIGVWKGWFSKHILENWDGTLIMVDLWKQQPSETYFDIMNQPYDIQEQCYQEAINSVSGFPGRYHILRMDSVLAAKTVEDELLDFVFLDANHSYEATWADLTAWYPKVRPGGIVSGHDFLDSENSCGSRFGVKSAVTEFVANFNMALNIADEQWPTWWFYKDEA